MAKRALVVKKDVRLVASWADTQSLVVWMLLSAELCAQKEDTSHRELSIISSISLSFVYRGPSVSGISPS